MKILFMDVDGVLNYRSIFIVGDPKFRGIHTLCDDAIARIHRVVAETGCFVVLSSTWRCHGSNVEALKARNGFPNPHPDFKTKEIHRTYQHSKILMPGRGFEIADWLGRNPGVTRYAIVDDDDDMLDEQRPFFVKTSFETGLLDHHADKLIEILNS